MCGGSMADGRGRGCVDMFGGCGNRRVVLLTVGKEEMSRNA